MGINNIHILIDPTPAQEAQAAMGLLVADHRQGKHPYGEKRRECPLCQQGK